MRAAIYIFILSLLISTVVYIQKNSCPLTGKQEIMAPVAIQKPMSVDESIKRRRAIKREMHTSIAEDLINKANEALQRSQPPYIYADRLLEEAEQEYGYAFGLSPSNAKPEVREAMKALEQLRDSIKPEVDLERNTIKEAMKKNRLAYGMTERQVIQIAGDPVTKEAVPEKDNYERWTFESDALASGITGKRRFHRFFQDGIFVAGQIPDVILKYEKLQEFQPQ